MLKQITSACSINYKHSANNTGASAGGTYLSVHTANVTLLICMRLCFHIADGAGALADNIINSLTIDK